MGERVCGGAIKSQLASFEFSKSDLSTMENPLFQVPQSRSLIHLCKQRLKCIGASLSLEGVIEPDLRSEPHFNAPSQLNSVAMQRHAKNLPPPAENQQGDFES